MVPKGWLGPLAEDEPTPRCGPSGDQQRRLQLPRTSMQVEPPLPARGAAIRQDATPAMGGKEVVDPP